MLSSTSAASTATGNQAPPCATDLARSRRRRTSSRVCPAVVMASPALSTLQHRVLRNAKAAQAAAARGRMGAMEYRIERDTMGEVQVPKDALWRAQTQRAVDNFPISGTRLERQHIRALAQIKAAAAMVNADLGVLDRAVAEAIAAAAADVAEGRHDDQFPIDVFQTGSGTSSNMNANEVLATLAGEDVHANDDVNMGQSSNDVFPSAVHLAALEQVTHDLIPALEQLGKIPLGGTAVGTGLNTHPEFAERVRALLAEETGLEIHPPADPFESQAARDALVETSGALKTVAVSLTKIANDLRFMGSGPRAGLAEILLPELQKGSSIMPGKVNPVIPEVVTQVAAQVIGNDQAIAIGGMSGHFELNVYVPMMARNLLDSIRLLASSTRLLAEKCVDGIEANRETCERYAELTLSAATALNPYIGYDAASELVKEAASSGRPLREIARDRGIPEDVLDKALDYRAMTRPQEG